MRKTAEKINTAAGIGAYAGIAGLVVSCAIGAIGHVSDLGQRGDLRDYVENTAVSFEAHVAMNGNEVMDDPVSSFPVDKNNFADDVTIKVTGNIQDGYCIIGTDSSIAEDKYSTLQYSSRDNSSDQFGPDTCDIDTTQASTVVEGSSAERGMQWDEWVSYFMFGSIGLCTASVVTGFTNASREEKYERSLPKQLASSSEPPKKPEAIDIPSGESCELPHLMAKVHSIKSEWSSYELDLVKLLEYPSVTDMSVLSTAEFHKAMKNVNYLSTLESVKSGAALGDFREAVLDLDHKFDVMINEAKRTKWNGYSKQEQDSLRTAQNLLAIATNSASSANERQVAYKRLIKEVEGILVFPEKTVLELETKVAPSITVSDLLGTHNMNSVVH